MLRMILQSREYAVWIFFRRLMDSANPPKVPNPYGAGCITAHAWTDGPPPATFTVAQRTLSALCDREGFSRIGRSSREHHVLPVSDNPTKWPTRTT